MSAFVVFCDKKEFCCKLYSMFFVPLWGMSAYLVFANRMEFCVFVQKLTCFNFLAVPLKHTLGCGLVRGDKTFDRKCFSIKLFVSFFCCRVVSVAFLSKALSMCACCVNSTCWIFCMKFARICNLCQIFLSPLTDPHPRACFRGTSQKIETSQSLHIPFFGICIWQVYSFMGCPV